MPSPRTPARATAAAAGPALPHRGTGDFADQVERLGSGPWRDLTGREQASALATAARDVVFTRGLCEPWLRALALPKDASPPGYSAVRRRLARACAAGAQRLRRGAGEPAWIVAEAALGPGRMLALAVEELAAGRPALVVVPEAAAEPLRAFEDYLLDALDLPDEDSPLAIVPLHGATPRGIFTAAHQADPGVEPERFVAALAASRAAELEAHALELRGAKALDLDVAAEDGPLAVHALRTAALVLGEHEDPEHAARRVARLAFGAPVAGGFLAEALGAVWVHPRCFAAFHAALLAALEGERGVPLSPSAKLPDFRDLFFVTRRLGLDEGATLIHDPGHATARSGPGHRAVFTNVEPGSRLARDLEPAAVLRILRVASPRPAAGGGTGARAGEASDSPSTAPLGRSEPRRSMEPYGWE